MDLAELGSEIKDFTSQANARLLAIEQKITAPNSGGGAGGGYCDIGSTVAQSPEFKDMVAGNRTRTGRISVPSFHQKTTIQNAAGLNQPLVAPFIMPGIRGPAQIRLTVRDLLPQLPVSSNMVEYCKESSFVSNAGMQTETVAKGESELNFVLSYSPIQTLAHWIPASKQVMDDSQALAGYINARLTYLLKLKEEQELLTGSGTGTELSGLITNATAFDTSYTNVTSDTFIDVIGHGIQQVEDLSGFQADAVIMNNRDWHTVTQIKSTITDYIYSNPHDAQQPRLWGVPVVPTKSMPRGQFLCGAFQLAAAIWDRNSTTIEISREHADFFTRNLIAVLVEERLCLTVFRSDALVYGGLPYGS